MTYEQLELEAALRRGAYATALVLLRESVDPRGIVAEDGTTGGRGCWEAFVTGFDEFKDFPPILPDVLRALAAQPPALEPNETTIDVLRLFLYEDPIEAGAEATIDFALVEPFFTQGTEAAWQGVLPRLGAWAPRIRQRIRTNTAQAAQPSVHTRGPARSSGL